MILAVVVAVVFAANVARLYFVGDDAYISFRYADNLVRGHGLVWNPGERVEGYTDFLWVLLLSAGIGVGLAPGPFACGLGIASSVAILALTVAHGARRHGIRDPFIWVAPLALALSRSFTAWSTGGLETQLFALLVFGGYLAFLRERERGAERPVGSALLFAAATLTRPDAVVLVSVPGAAFLVDVLRRKRPVKAMLAWALPYLVVVGAHLIFRRVYYGDWVPNTFHAKVSGVWWSQAFHYLRLFHEDYQILWFAPLVVLAVAVRRDAATLLFAGAWAAQLAYILWVGGDRFEFRFLVHVFPMLYLLLADGLRIVARWEGPPIRRRVFAVVAMLAATTLLATTVNGGLRPEAKRERGGVTSIENLRQHASLRARQGKQIRRWVKARLLPADLRLAVGGAGALPFYARLKTVDYRGLNDAYVARLPIARRGLIGHEKAAPPAYLAKRRVDVFDILNQLVFTRNEASTQEHVAEAEQKVRRIDRKGEYLRVACLRVQNRHLIFATTLSPDALRARFPRLSPCEPAAP